MKPTVNESIDLLKLLSAAQSKISAALGMNAMKQESFDTFLTVERDLKRETGVVVARVLSHYPFLATQISSLGLDPEDASLDR
jgi:hypothetical protein